MKNLARLAGRRRLSGPALKFVLSLCLASTLVAAEGLLVSVQPAAAVATLTPTNVVTHAPTTPTLGQSVTFTATVSGTVSDPTPTGTLTWNVSGTAGVTTCASTSGPTGATYFVTYTCTLTASKAGTYAVYAVYPGDSNYVPVTSNTDTITVVQVTPTNVVTHSPSSPTVGQVIIFTDTIAAPLNGATPTGSPTWHLSGPATTCSANGGPTGSANIVTYTCSVLDSTQGTYGAYAVYAGDINYIGSTSNSDSVVVAKATPSNVVTNSSPTQIGQSLIFTATISGPSGGATPTGTVLWTFTGPISSCASVTGPTGTGTVVTYTCTITPLTLATYSATAAYSGDANYNTVTSAADSVVVGKATPTNVVTHLPVAPTISQSITFTSTVTGYIGGPTPTGTATWNLSGPVTTCASQTGPTGSTNTVTYTCTIVASKAGTYSAWAVYPGNTTYNTITSNVDSVVVAKVTPTNVVTNVPTNPTLGQPLTFTATVTGPSGGATPTGTLTWTLAGVIASCATQTGPTGTTNVATYTCTITPAIAGSYSATAVYLGDTDYNAIASAADAVNALTAQPALTITTTIAKYGTPLALITSGGSGSGALSFSVVNGTAKGCAIVGATLKSTGIGTCLVIATKAGDSNYQSVSSAVTTVTVVLPPIPPKVTVTFNRGSAALTSAGASALRSLARKLAPGAQLAITSYARGNASLATQRFLTVRNYLQRMVKISATKRLITNASSNNVVVVTTRQ